MDLATSQPCDRPEPRVVELDHVDESALSQEARQTNVSCHHHIVVIIIIIIITFPEIHV